MSRPLGLTYRTDRAFLSATRRFHSRIAALARREMKQRKVRAIAQSTKLWRDQHGGVLSLELLLVGLVLGIGCVTGLSAVRDAIVRELRHVSTQIQRLEQQTKVETEEVVNHGAHPTCLVVCVTSDHQP